MAEPKLVVYVEDNDANFALVRRVLEVTGDYEVIRAVDGETGLDLIAEHRPDVILLDLDLPGIDGFEVARQLKADPVLSGIPFMVISASVMKRERRQALDLGARCFLEKPFEIAELRELVGDLC